MIRDRETFQPASHQCHRLSNDVVLKSHRGPFSPLLVVAFAWAITLSPQPATAKWLPYEIGIANREAGRMCFLAERLDKQNLLYQLDMANLKKLDMHIAVNEFDRIFEQLKSGSAYYSVAGPPNDAARKQLDVIEKAWFPVRKLAMASPYDYLRRAQQFFPPDNPRGDPLAVKSFDKLAGDLIVAIETLMTVYYEACIKTEYGLCAVSRRSGQPTMMAERIMKNLILIHEGIDPEQNIKRLNESIKAFDDNWISFEQTDLYRRATAESRGTTGELIADLRARISASWVKLHAEAILAVGGRVNEVNLEPTLRIQRKLVDDFDRFTAILGRFAAGGLGG